MPWSSSSTGNPDRKDLFMHALDAFFEPRSVAVIGASATPGKAGHEVLANIKANGFSGKVYPVNPRGGEIYGWAVAKSIAELPDGIDLAVIVLPADTTPKALRECASKGIRAAVLPAGGFAEIGAEGLALQAELDAVTAETKIRVLGPNTSGHTSTPVGFTSAFFPLGKIPRGRISYIAQTGNFATHTMRYIMSAESYGVARVIGLGNKVDLEESEALEYLGDDPETDAIMMYLESFKNPARFFDVARRVTRKKPVIMLKGGVSEAGGSAAVAHTAALAADNRIVKGALRQAGIVQIERYNQLIQVAKALSMVRPPRGNRVGFVAPSGAFLVTMTDLCIRHGLVVPAVEEATRAHLQEISPSYIRMRNPVDIWGSALLHGFGYAYQQGIEALLKDPNLDAVVAILMLAGSNLPSLDFIPELAARYPEKPLLLSFSGDLQNFHTTKASLEAKGVPCFPLMEEPFEVLDVLWRYRQVQQRPHTEAD
jgi:acetate---CoA ligase (ADP-forming)